MPESPLTVRDLRRQWKQHKERLNEINPQHPTNVRFHRACSWMRRAEEISGKDDLDFALLSQWTAFNALYGQWDESKREPISDCASWRSFLDRMIALDKNSAIADALTENKPLVISIYDDEYLSRYFWEEPSGKRANQSKKPKYESRTWYFEGNWTMILDRLIERIYLMRCQLVHGAATYNSSLNRAASRRCSQMMDHLLKAFLLVWINDGADEDWGCMCYPPMGMKVGAR